MSIQPLTPEAVQQKLAEIKELVDQLAYDRFWGAANHVNALEGDVHNLVRKNEELEARLEAVKALHKPEEFDEEWTNYCEEWTNYCPVCGDSYMIEWPCPTYLAATGGEA